MRKTIFLTLLVTLPFITCMGRPSSIPVGTWEYDLYVNGVKSGKSVTAVKLENGLYTTETSMQMNAGIITNTSMNRITETVDFKPVRLENVNSIIQGDKVRKIEITALFEGNAVTVKTGSSSVSVKLPGPCVLDGTYFISELIRKGFRNGTRVSARIYEPAIELEELITVNVRVNGIKRVKVGREKKRLYHVSYIIQDMKNIECYINKNGITELATITMLNNRMDLVLRNK